MRYEPICETYELPTDSYAREQGCTLSLEYPHQIGLWASKHLQITKDCEAGLAGQPIILQDFQQKLLNTALGWRLPSGRLRFSRVYCFISRRAGKTLLNAINVLNNLLQGNGKQLCCLGATTKQAAQLFDQVADWIRLGEKLGAHKYRFCGHNFWIRQHRNEIIVEDTGSKVEIIAVTNRGAASRGLILTICDEIASWPKAYVDATWSQLSSSGTSVPNSQLWTISTPNTNFNHLWRTRIYKKCRSILDGADNDISVLPVDYAMPPEVFGDGPVDEQWAGFNYIPAAGKTVLKSTIVQEWASAKSDPCDSVDFKINTCCMHEQSPEVWIDENSWAKCSEKFDEKDLYHKYPCICAIDCATCFDLASIMILVQKDDKIYLCPRGFVPFERASQRQTADHFPYISASKDPKSNLFLPPGEVIPGETIVERVLQDRGLFGFKTVYYDPKRMEINRQQLEKHKLEMVPVSTAPSTMSQLAKHFKSLVVMGRIRHANEPLMNYCLRNCRPKINEKEELTIEKASAYAKIDHIISAIIGCAHFFKHVEIAKPRQQSYVKVWSA